MFTCRGLYFLVRGFFLFEPINPFPIYQHSIGSEAPACRTAPRLYFASDWNKRKN